jgi:alkylation response protein AidB-like acyl-CoA dehydrogenase
MNFKYSDIQVELQDSLRKYYEKNYGFEKRQHYSCVDPGFSELAWEHYANIGLLALTFPQSLGGLSETEESDSSTLVANNAIESMWIMEQMGASLCLEPYLSTVVMGGGTLLSHGSASQKSELIPKIASGELRIAAALEEPSSRYSYACVKTIASALPRAASSPPAWVITGHKCAVLSASSAGMLLVSARTAGSAKDRTGISMFCIPVDAKGVSITSYSTHDGMRASDIELSEVLVTQEQLIGQLDLGIDVIEEMVARANSALCAEAVGIMSTLCNLTLAYLKTRQQFGVPIGKFQALQHRMADMIVSTEQARSMAFLAAQAHTSSDKKKLMRDVSAAKAYICKSGRTVGQEAIQLHGGMGVTHELSVGHYFKRLTLIAHTFGDFNQHIGVVSDYLSN